MKAITLSLCLKYPCLNTNMSFFCLKKKYFLKIIEKKFVRIKNITNFATKQ